MDPELPGGAGGPVTTTVSRRVKPGHEAAYERFLTGISGAARAFPGYLGVEVFRSAPGGDGEYRIIYRFDTVAHLHTWLDSAEHAAWLQRAEPHVAGPIQTQVLTGLEGWFTLPSQPGAPLPPPAKMALVTWATIFPLITGVVVATAPVVGGWPLVARLAVTTGVTVPLMTWVVMPRVTRLLRPWLYPDPGRGHDPPTLDPRRFSMLGAADARPGVTAGRPAGLRGRHGDNATPEQEATTMAFPGPRRHDQRNRRPTTATGHRLAPVGRRLVLMALAGLLAAALSACASGAAFEAPPATADNDGGPTVTIQDLAYTPATLTVAAGATVTWVWQDGAIAHDVKGDGFRSEVMAEGTFSHDPFPSTPTQDAA